MNIIPFSLFRLIVAILVGAAVSTACDTRATRLHSAFAKYQAASASGDLRATRNALLEVVAADEDVADYWLELSKVQIALQAYPDAYYAASRALELDRGNQEVLNILTQLALRSGELDLAEKYARSLEMLVPDDAAVKITHGIIALRRGELKIANEQANQILAIQPDSSDAKILKSQILLREGRTGDAVALLKAQIQANPRDIASHRALAALYEHGGDRQRVAQTRKSIWDLDRTNMDAAVDYVEAAFRAGDAIGARAASLTVMRDDASPAVIQALLDQWRKYWPGPARVDEARRLARDAMPSQKLVYAAFLNDVGAWPAALPLVSPDARLPVSAANIAPNTIMATSLLLSGKLEAAESRIDEILALDPGNVEALRTRIQLNLIRRNSKDAVADARKIVSLEPGSARHRLLLAQAFAANGDKRNVRRVLWESFRDLPKDNDEIYPALRKLLASSNDQVALRSLDQEYSAQRQAGYLRDFT